MAAAALIKLTQGLNVGADGQALFGVTGTAVNVTNAVNTGVASWEIELLAAPITSALALGVLASSNNGSTPAAAFTPDARGGYRLRLRVWAALNRSGDPTDTDIRCFGVKETNGYYIPVPQLWPRPLPPVASGETGAHADENNFAGQASGWAGTGADGLLASLIKAMFPPNTLPTLVVDGITRGAVQLTTLDATNLPDRMTVRVTSILDEVWLDKTSVLTPDGATIFAAVGGGNWIRKKLPHAKWSTKQSWEYDATAGSLEGDGSSGDKVNSFAEIRRRMGDVYFNSGTFRINVTGNVPSTEELYFGFIKRGTIEIIPAAPTSFYAGTVTAVPTVQDKVAGTVWSITDSAIPVSATASNLLGKLVVFRNAGVITATAYVDKDLGSKTYTITPPTIRDPLVFSQSTASSSAGTPAVGNTITVYQMQEWACAKTIVLEDGGTLFQYGFKCTSAVSGPRPGGRWVTVICTFEGSATFGPGNQVNCLSRGAATWFKGGDSAGPVDCSFIGSGSITIARDNWSSTGEFFMRGRAFNVNGFNAVVFNGDIAIVDWPAVGHAFNATDNGRVICARLWGSGNAGKIINCSFGSTVFYNRNQGTPTLLVTTTEPLPILLAGVDYAINAIPLADPAHDALIYTN